LLLTAGAAAAAQRTASPPSTPAATTVPDENQVVGFSADTVSFDSDTDVVTATGEVRMNREGNSLAADPVIWNRKSGQV